MSAEQIHLAGMVVTIFSAALCVAQALIDERIHYLWLLLLLAGIVAWVVA